jgi:uncharacterized protein (TIGR02118 family)
MLYLVAEFDFNHASFSPEEAERHYHEYHVPLASRLPGLRRYVIGTLARTQYIKAEHHRGAILAFDDVEALRAAYRSPAGRELRDDERALIAHPRALLIAGQEIV